MSINWIKLSTESILHLPLSKYENNFTFIVNDKRYETSFVVAELLSPKLAQFRQQDPTIDEIRINTRSSGDFQHILDLINFETQKISTNEIDFLSEIFDHLGSESITVNILQGENTINNVIENLSQHEKSSHFFKSQFESEIDFLSSHFYELCEERFEELGKISIDTICSVLGNSKLQLESEDQLVKAVNKLCERGEEFSVLYEFCDFVNAESSTIDSFLRIFNPNSMTNGVWESISRVMRQESVRRKEIQTGRVRTKQENGQLFEYREGGEFDGIINHMRKKSSDNINSEINVTASSILGGRQPKNVFLFEDKGKDFASNDLPNSWLCFEFKNHSIIPTHYTIRHSVGNCYSRGWKIEVSNDNKSWETIDERRDVSFSFEQQFHTFKIEKQTNQKSKFIRIQATQPYNQSSTFFLIINSIEFFGSLI